MKLDNLREEQAKFVPRIEELTIKKKELYKLRDKFVRHFSINRINSMTLKEYVIGYRRPNDQINFCYGIERELGGLGLIIGATAYKFGVYYGREKNDPEYKYRFTKKFGNNVNEAFIKVKASIVTLLQSGQTEDFNSIISNPLSNMFKGKILSTYFPEKYLNIFAKEHLDFFITQLNIDTKELIESNEVIKREALLDYKNNDIIMKNWKIDIFADFLYTYLGKPQNKTNSTILSDFELPTFPLNPTPAFIELNILPPNLNENLNTTESANAKRRKSDHINKQRLYVKLGERGEKIVMNMEKNWLIENGRSDLAIKIKQVSEESDSFGYDILSFELNGDEKYIEVKATRAKPGVTNFFLSASELEKATKIDNYYLYLVYEITKSSPKIWKIKNPFKPENKYFIKTPILYKYNLNAE